MALRIAAQAEAAGVRKEDIFVDCLALSASVAQKDVLITSDAIRLIKNKGYKTVLGVSNISFGLPDRDVLNSVFLAVCLTSGLNLAIVNTSSKRIMDTVDASRVLTGEDTACSDYLKRTKVSESPEKQLAATLESMIESGRKSDVPETVKTLLKMETPLEIINNRIIPALNHVSAEYESGELFLPQLMASADAVKIAFGVLENDMPADSTHKGTIILATVRGDIHDIGKNIVRMLLENYGYCVIDLGRDVSEEVLVQTVLESKAKLVGLSALMTTTAVNMESAIQALRDAGADCKIMVGGAVVTQEFADQISADYYSRDAASAARIAAEVFGQ